MSVALIFSPDAVNKIISITAPGIKGRTEAVKATCRLLDITIAKKNIPQIKLVTVPTVSPDAKLTMFFLLAPIPTIKAITGKDNINPPVGPETTPKPPLKLENTGIPTAPSSM